MTPSACHTQSDLTSELSTTIIRASPVPPEEAELSLQQSGVPSEAGARKAAAAVSLSSGPHNTEPSFTSSQDTSLESGKLWEARQAAGTSRCRTGQVLGQPALGHWARPASPQLLVPGLQPVIEGQRTVSEETSSEFSGQASRRDVPRHQLTAAAQGQSVPPACAALWAGPPLPTATLAQQYTGTHVTLPPPCHAGSAPIYGFSGCPPYPAMVGEQAQNPVAVGLCLGPSLASGLLGPSALCNSCSDALHQNLHSTANPLPMHPASATCGIEPWNSGMTTGFGKVLFLLL